MIIMRSLLVVVVFWFGTWGGGAGAVCVPEKGCDVAYAFYRVEKTEDLASIGTKFQTTQEAIQAVNPRVTDVNFILTGDPLYIPFKCNCVNDQLTYTFHYQVVKDNSYTNISSVIYQNLTQPNWIATGSDFVRAGRSVEIPVNCSCGNPDVNSSFGLFLTYPVVAGTGGNLSGVAADFNTTPQIITKFNPSVIWENSQPLQHAFIPVPDATGKYPPFRGGTSEFLSSARRLYISSQIECRKVFKFRCDSGGCGGGNSGLSPHSSSCLLLCSCVQTKEIPQACRPTLRANWWKLLWISQ